MEDAADFSQILLAKYKNGLKNTQDGTRQDSLTSKIRLLYQIEQMNALWLDIKFGFSTNCYEKI